MLLMVIQRCQSETYWPYICDPPVLHPVIWEGRETVVVVNDTRLLDQPATQEFLIAQNFWVFFGYDKRIHLFFLQKKYYFRWMSWKVFKTNNGA